MTTHIMTDCETLGTRPGAIVTSVALVRFADEASTTINLSIPDQEALGLTQDPDTLAWWMQQDPVAHTAAFSNPVSLRPALEHIAAWIRWAGSSERCADLVPRRRVRRSHSGIRLQGRRHPLPVGVVEREMHAHPVRPGVHR